VTSAVLERVSVADGMPDLIEKKFQDLVLDADSAGLLELKVMYRGEPGIVPVKLYPFSVVFISHSEEVTRPQDGYTPSTGERYWRHDGYCAFEVLFRDTETLMPDASRRATVGSYDFAKELAKQALREMLKWSPDDAAIEMIEEDSGHAHRTVGELYFDEIENAMTRRTQETTANRSQVTFHMYSREDLF
jgi:hypothetical protein